MKSFKKPLIAIATVAVLGTGTAVGIQTAHAATPPARTSLIDALVAKFHLNKSDVETVFKQTHEENMASRQQAFTDRLTQAVKDGKLTQAQADAITAKQAEVKAFMDSLKDKAPAERKTAIKQEQKDLATWAKDNDIPAQFTHIARPMMGHGMGFERPMGNAMHPDAQ
ncbi:MAG: hypothetical protein K8Q97_01720 [Candidatus Andersenbacteria bacterium]|nr:hypothetical protein [Candidatus Andersenbacteria bacterium]